MKIKKLNKKAGDIASYMMLFIAIFLIGIVFSFALFHTYSLEKIASLDIKEKITKADTELRLSSILRAPVKDKTVADIVVESYLNDNYDELEKEMHMIVKTYFADETDWELLINDKKIASFKTLAFKSKKHTYETFLPLITPNKNNIQVTLNTYN